MPTGFQLESINKIQFGKTLSLGEWNYHLLKDFILFKTAVITPTKHQKGTGGSQTFRVLLCNPRQITSLHMGLALEINRISFQIPNVSNEHSVYCMQAKAHKTWLACMHGGGGRRGQAGHSPGHRAVTLLEMLSVVSRVLKNKNCL